MAELKIAVVDTETTGMSDDDALVEFGCVPIFTENLSSESGFNPWVDPTFGRSKFINPQMDIPVDAMAIHHITNEMASGGLLPQDAIKKCLMETGVFYPDYIVAHNMDFDWKFLKEFFDPEIRKICTYKVALAAYPDAPNHKNVSIFYYLNLHIKPSGLSQEFFERNSLHRALPDAIITAFIFREMMGIFSLDEMVQITKLPGLMAKCMFGKKHYGELWADIPKGYLDYIVDKVTDKPDVIYSAQREIIRRARGDHHSSHPKGK